MRATIPPSAALDMSPTARPFRVLGAEVDEALDAIA
jgi:hypothetical protein